MHLCITEKTFFFPSLSVYFLSNLNLNLLTFSVDNENSINVIKLDVRHRLCWKEKNNQANIPCSKYELALLRIFMTNLFQGFLMMKFESSSLTWISNPTEKTVLVLIRKFLGTVKACNLIVLFLVFLMVEIKISLSLNFVLTIKRETNSFLELGIKQTS